MKLKKLLMATIKGVGVLAVFALIALGLVLLSQKYFWMVILILVLSLIGCLAFVFYCFDDKESSHE